MRAIIRLLQSTREKERTRERGREGERGGEREREEREKNESTNFISRGYWSRLIVFLQPALTHERLIYTLLSGSGSILTLLDLSAAFDNRP